MRTTKKLVVVCLALLLGVVAIMPSTFSWYNHNGSYSGDRMNYTRNDLPVSGGSISAVTKKFYMEKEYLQQIKNISGGSPDNVYYDEKGNKLYNGGAIESGSIATGTSQYYGTTFTNTGTAPAYVNLYLGTFKNNKNFYIGTTAPNLTEKGLSPTVHLANNRIVRVYFQWDKAGNNWTSTNATRYVVCNTPSGKSIKEIPTTNVLENKPALTNVTTYYVDLEKDTTSFYFATNGKVNATDTSGFDTSTGSTTSTWYRTKTITDVQAGKGYYLTGESDDTTWNAAYTSFEIENGLSVMKQFDKATMNPGQKAYVTLNRGIHYTGSSATYAVTSGSNISVNANTGLVTTTDGFDNGVITTTLTSPLGDTKTITTSISKPDTLDFATVATNIKIPGAKTEVVDGERVTTNGKAEVVWYVRNRDSNTSCTFSSIYYTK